MEMNTKGKESFDDYKGNSPPEPGRYHVTIVDIDETFEKHNALIVTFAVVTGDKEEMEGRQLREMFFLTDNGQASDAICRLAMVLGLIKGGEEGNVDFSTAIGSSLIIGVAKRKKKDDPTVEYTNIADWGVATWPIGHPDVADVPIDKAFIADGGNEPAASSDSKSDKSDDEWNM